MFRYLFLEISNACHQSFLSSESLSCSREAEAVFLLDASTDDASFASIKQLVINILSEVEVSQKATRVSIILFGTSSRLVVQLDEITNHQELSSKVAQLVSINDGRRNLDVAIQLALQELQDEGRVGVVQIVYVVLTNAVDNVKATIETALSAERNNVLVFGIGTSAAKADLSLITSPNVNRSLFIADFNLNVASVRTSVVEALCNEGKL